MITPFPPKVVADALYNSTQASQILGVHRNHFRRYVKAGYIHPKVDYVTGRNLFEGCELTRFWYGRIKRH